MKTIAIRQFAPFGLPNMSPTTNLKGFGQGMSAVSAITIVAIVLLIEACRPQPVYGDESPSSTAGMFQIEPYPVRASMEIPSIVPARLIAPAGSRASERQSMVGFSSMPASPKTIGGNVGVGLYYAQVSGGSADAQKSVFSRWFQTRQYFGLVVSKLTLAVPGQLSHVSRNSSSGGAVVLGFAWRPYDRSGS